jgi:hypothetical protein
VNERILGHSFRKFVSLSYCAENVRQCADACTISDQHPEKQLLDGKGDLRDCITQRFLCDGKKPSCKLTDVNLENKFSG